MIKEVKLVGMTQPEEHTGCKTASELVAYIARVSNPTNQNNTKTAPRLLKYLIKNSHWSPFECVNLTFEIATTRDISRQILRHRSFSFQEFSGRYSEMDNFISDREARLQDLKNRQNSIRLDDELLQTEWESRQNLLLSESLKVYRWALDNNIAKEQARAVLPEGLTGTRLYMQGSLRSWIHYCMLRMANGTQLEHMEIAIDVWSIIKKHFPDVVTAIELLEAENVVMEEFKKSIHAVAKFLLSDKPLSEADKKLLNSYLRMYDQIKEI